MKKRFVLSVLLLVVFISNIFAHALWIETLSVGKKGVAQEVRIYFGEFADKDLTPTAKWFSDTRSFSLILITPDKREIRLNATQQNEYFSATFTPEKDGVYTVLLHHVVKEVYHGNRLDYNSSACVRVGDVTAEPVPSFTNIGIYADGKTGFKKEQAIRFTAFLDNKPAGKTEVEVVAPNGWSKKVYTDSAGSASFTPLWPGKYNLEFSRSDTKSGQHQGKTYETEWRGANYVVDVTDKK
ncbi:MAG: hypothetical protein EOO04_18090 [Chitinophagaceae bacterium]|nr:MAG: hypothetical protein EOO04_18090 [Chitinophagaceae bacterium]